MQVGRNHRDLFVKGQGSTVANGLSARAIIKAFHDTLEDGHEYRQAIRMVANAQFDVPLEPAIEAAKVVVKLSLKLSGVSEDDQAKAISLRCDAFNS